jgi:hypothetical protein
MNADNCTIQLQLLLACQAQKHLMGGNEVGSAQLDRTPEWQVMW